MNQTTVVLLIAAAFLLVTAVLLLLWKKPARIPGETEYLDKDYAYHLNDIYLRTGNVLRTFEKLEEIYEENRYMSERIKKSLDYLTGEYGDFETAFSYMNEHEDIQIETLHKEIIRLENAKTMGLPGGMEHVE